ncbi:hypothetical protein [Mucilaginibacter terrae]|uniref:Uncharacterized protein n=1 Tax=Mucilaginibacter terrae TaxID=1955052 RepID=A0ABU3GML5_9SPHI|nr:hypothetical protein [Mucilaginibacter terrae]MDT3401038.1 hypothetical protein [Mucilaginibacter terrae]
MKKKFGVLQPLLKRSPHGAVVIKPKLMLSSVSWQQFLAVLTFIVLAYYCYVGLRYYQKELWAFVNRKPATGKLPSPNLTSSFQVMGLAKPDHGVSISDTSDLQFAVEEEPETEIASKGHEVVVNTRPQDPTNDLLQDVSHLVEAFKEIDDKSEFLSLLRIQYSSYRSPEANSVDWPSVKQRTLMLSKDKLPFTVTEADIQHN